MTEKEMLKAICQNHKCDTCPAAGTEISCFNIMLFDKDVSDIDKIRITTVYNRYKNIHLSEEDIIALL